MSSTGARRYLISGRVQGVFFRATCRTEAIRLGLRGTARNLTDGRVEVIAAGEPEALQALLDWLWSGPPLARVEDVLEYEFSGSLPERFATY